jgi:two-component system cell cycle sensor histidine kinase/response regulator CckA
VLFEKPNAVKITKIQKANRICSFTDVVMPGMNGRDLYERLRHILPDLKVLFMSGYAGSVITHHGILNEGVNFIQKPFLIHALSRKVRQVLDSQQAEEN